MCNMTLALAEFVSAALSFILARFMLKPYLYTGEGRYVGLPFGFTFLGMSYLFMGLTFSLSSNPFVEEIKWLQLFTEAYAFAFLALTYYFSKKKARSSTRLWWESIYSALIVGMVATYFLILEPSSAIFTLPNYNVADRYISVFDIVLASYVCIYTIRSHALSPDPKTVMAPLGYILLAFGEYSSLIWSPDSSLSALIGAYIIRLAGLVVFLSISFKAFFSWDSK
jgi:FtsH-binding integral membrane protein